MNKKTAIVPGSFDPMTLGHVDLVTRAAKIFDEVLVVVAENENKKYMLTPKERVEAARIALEGVENASVTYTDGIVADVAAKVGAVALVKGIRNSADLEYENNIAKVNKELAPELETVYLPASGEYATVSSTAVRKLFSYGLPIEQLVGKKVAEYITKSR